VSRATSTSREDRVLVVSHRDDAHAHAVIRKLSEVSGRADPAVLFDIATFPIGSRLAAGPGGAGALGAHPALPEVYGSGTDALLRATPTTELDALELNRVRAVYWRRPRPTVTDTSIADPDLALYVAKASRETIYGSIEALALTHTVIDQPTSVARGSLKVLQLDVARRHGLRVPGTLVTNDPVAAGGFVRDRRARGIEVVSKSPSDLSHFAARTELVDDRKLEQLATLQLAPAILQERVDGGPDLRVTVVGQRVFGMAVTPDPRFAPDVRLDPAPRREPYRVAAELRSGILAMQRALGLSFGAYDFKCDAAGVPHFLEVNPVGQWLGMEFATRQPIAEALARLLWDGPGAELETTGEALRDDELDALFPQTVQAEYAVMRDLAAAQKPPCLVSAPTP
jgi:glutathione synthase/RimK-type ligase-like ATP-grasp enzyme